MRNLITCFVTLLFVASSALAGSFSSEANLYSPNVGEVGYGALVSDNFATKIEQGLPYGVFTAPISSAVGDVVYVDGASSVALAQADAESTSKVVGIIVEKINSTTARIRTSSWFSYPGSLTPGATYYLSDTTPGAITSTEPTPPNLSVPIGVARDANTLFVPLAWFSTLASSATPTFQEIYDNDTSVASFQLDVGGEFQVEDDESDTIFRVADDDLQLGALNVDEAGLVSGIFKIKADFGSSLALDNTDPTNPIEIQNNGTPVLRVSNDQIDLLANEVLNQGLVVGDSVEDLTFQLGDPARIFEIVASNGTTQLLNVDETGNLGVDTITDSTGGTGPSFPNGVVLTGDLDMNNNDVREVDRLLFNDPTGRIIDLAFIESPTATEFIWFIDGNWTVQDTAAYFRRFGTDVYMQPDATGLLHLRSGDNADRILISESDPEIQMLGDVDLDGFDLRDVADIIGDPALNITVRPEVNRAFVVRNPADTLDMVNVGGGNDAFIRSSGTGNVVQLRDGTNVVRLQVDDVGDNVQMTGDVSITSGDLDMGDGDISEVDSLTGDSANFSDLTISALGVDSDVFIRPGTTGQVNLANSIGQVQFQISSAGAAEIVANGLFMNNLKIQDLLDPTAAQDAATKNYADTNEANLDHDALQNFIANEHIDHTAVTLTAGEGLQGGGDISASRIFDLDVNGLTTETGVDGAADFVPFYDASAAGHRKATPEDIVASGMSGGVVNVTQTAGTSTTSATYVVMTGMTTTPAAGTYSCTFSTSGWATSTGADMQYAIFSGGTISAASERDMNFNGGAQVTNNRLPVFTQAVVTVNGAQAIDVRYLTNIGTFNVLERSLICLRVGN